MPLARLLVDDSAVTADLHGISTVPLVRRHELDAAMAVPVVVQVPKRRNPLAGLFLGREWPPWVIRPVFGRAEQGTPGLVQRLSQALLPVLSAWFEVGVIAPSLCLKAPPPQPIST